MPIFVPDPFTSRAWTLPGTLPGGGHARGLRKAVAGKRVLITGASSGIGEEAARKLGAAGATTLLVARSVDRLGEFAEEIRSAGGEAYAHPADLSNPEAIDRLIAEVIDQHGGVDVLVNNAGRSIRRSVRASFDRPHDYERTMQLNYFASLRLILGFSPGMRERRDGQVVNVSSMGVQMLAPRFSAYIASKAALDAFTRIFAAEVQAYGVDCTTVHMPLVRTPMIAPTKAYDHAPAMSPQDAGEMVCEAIRSRRAQVDMPLGAFGEVADVVVPGITTRVRSLGYHAMRGVRRSSGELPEA